MRRKDREVTDPARIKEIINQCEYCRVGFHDDGEVYIVPLNFGFEEKDNTYTLYFHGANEGRKSDLIAKKPEVGFEMDGKYTLQEADTACMHSALFQSVIGNGTISFVEDPEEKKKGLTLLMEHTTGKSWSFDDTMIKSVAVFKIEVSKLSCKEH